MVPSKKSLPVSLKNSVDHFINLFQVNINVNCCRTLEITEIA